MNRRKFIQKLLGTAAVAAGGVAIADDIVYFKNNTDKEISIPLNSYRDKNEWYLKTPPDFGMAERYQDEGAITTKGSIPRMLQAGVNDLFKKEYGHL